MNLTRLILRDFRHYRKAFLAILAGTVISTAVLTGALILGDSVNFSLKRITVARLGNIRYAMMSGDRFFRQDLAGDISLKTGSITAPAMVSEGIAVNPENNKRINRVQIVGIDSRFTMLWDKPPACPDANTTVISRNTADKLGLKPGDGFILRISRQGMAPANAPFVAEKSPMTSIRLTVRSIAGDANMGLFSLNNNQVPPYSVFVSLGKIANLLHLKGYANLLLLPGQVTAQSGLPDSILRQVWKPQDASMDFRKLRQSGVYELRSARIFLDNKTSEAARACLPSGQGFLTYLANSLRFKDRSTPYSFITAASPDFLGTDPGRDGIIINSWLASDLGAEQGDSVSLKYFIMGPRRQLREDSSLFVVRKIIPIEDSIWDPELMPAFPGMSEAGNCRDWKTGAPIDLKRIRDKDESYWNRYHGTPKAFISLETGQRLWANPFGSLTSFRFKPGPADAGHIGRDILNKLVPREQGLSFVPVYLQGMNAAGGTTDFGSLFLSLGFFIILAALLLIALLFSLHLSNRMRETGILSAIGFRKNQILRIILSEGLLVAAAGSILGAFTGILYNKLMLLALNTIWQDAVGATGIVMTIRTSSLLFGSLAGMVTALLVMVIVLLKNLGKSIRQQTFAGSRVSSDIPTDKRHKVSIALALIFTAGSAGLAAWLLIFSGGISPSLFLASGAMMLAGGSFAIASLLQCRHTLSFKPSGGLFLLSLKNAAMKKSRTMTVVILIALGTFCIMITAAYRKTLPNAENKPGSGSGGFLLWAESSIPLRYDPSSPQGKKEYALDDEPGLEKALIFPMQKLDGDDASCLNLNLAARPSILAVPAAEFSRKGSFTFLSLLPGISRADPWMALGIPPAPGIIPAFADQTVITWGLKKKIGDTLFYTGDKGETVGLKLMAGLDNSVFQGYLLVSDSLFRIHFPSVNGFKVFLIDAADSSAGSISESLEEAFGDYGMTVTTAAAKLASFNAVENTYLSIFMLLGALGVIIGTAGLGLVLLRNMNEREYELAVYIALGYKRNFIRLLVMAEYSMMLIAGTVLGILSAIMGILPSLLSGSSQLNGLSLLLPGTLVLINGLFWVWLSARAVLKTLRSDALSKGLAM